ncbi:MAG: transcription elongation factor GreA [Wenzhouxiangellaceae bacterium]
MQRIPLTQEGADRLRKELEHLKKVVRPQIIEAIAEARAHGDLKENAEYHAAREQQGFTEGRIQEIESGLAAAQIIDPSKLNPGDRVVFGAIVVLAEVESGKETTYQLVGELEADIKEKRISVTSPIGKALIGKSQGDEVEVQAPAGATAYEIVSIEYR